MCLYVSAHGGYISVHVSQSSLIWTPVIWAPPSTRQLICPILYGDVAEIVGNAVGVAYYSLCITNLSYGHPLIPRRPDKRGLTVYRIEGKFKFR